MTLGMPSEFDLKMRARALLLVKDITTHLMTWDELEAYALGYISFVAAVRPNGDVTLQGIDDPEKIQKVPGQFLRLDFNNYWVCSPLDADVAKTPMTLFLYKERMRAWLEPIPMLATERTKLLQALDDVHALDQPSFTDFVDLLLSHPATEHEIRRDLVVYVPDATDLAILLDNAKNLLAKPKGGKCGKGRHLH
jgi:hypothetical protein